MSEPAEWEVELLRSCEWNALEDIPDNTVVANSALQRFCRIGGKYYYTAACNPSGYGWIETSGLPVWNITGPFHLAAAEVPLILGKEVMMTGKKKRSDDFFAELGL